MTVATDEEDGGGGGREAREEEEEAAASGPPWRRWARAVAAVAVVIAYHVYLAFAVQTDWKRCVSWCSGSKLLVLITCLVYGVLLARALVAWTENQWRIRGLPSLSDLATRCDPNHHRRRYTRWFLFSLWLIGVATFYAIDTSGRRRRLISLGGVALILLLGFVGSKHRTQIQWRQVVCGLSVQWLVGVGVLRVKSGGLVFRCLADKVVSFLSFADAGSDFVFGYLASGHAPNVTVASLGSFDVRIEACFAFKVLPVLIYFSFIVAILYYYGVMQRVVRSAGWLLQTTVGTTAAESLNAAASVFVGQSEAPLVIRPYLEVLTLSEWHAVMAGGFATIAGTVFAAYVSFGIDAVYLLSAAIMSAPGALGLSKLVYPETEVTKTGFESIRLEKSNVDGRNVLEASVRGIVTGLSMAGGIAASLIAFVAFVHLLDGLCAWAGALVDFPFVTLEWLLGKAFIPFAFLMGADTEDLDEVGTLLGIKTVVNEFVAYRRLSQTPQLSERSRAIATFALCSFSNVASLGSQVAILGGLVPSRQLDVALVGPRALFTGAAASFVTACIAGSLLNV